jgi:hypothetical protein
MWQLSAVYFVIIFIILLFGIISLPRRSKRVRLELPDGAQIAKDAMARPMPDIAKASFQQAALGKEPGSYSLDQKIAASPQAAKR